MANGEEGADGQVVQLADLENSMAVFASHEGPSREQLGKKWSISGKISSYTSTSFVVFDL